MLELAGKIALVTGAGRGLGRAVAVALAARGATVVIVSRTAEQLAETANAIRARGGSVQALPADVSHADAVESLRARVDAELGAPQVLVNAAGVFGPIGKIVDGDPRQWIETLAVNTLGPYLTCRAFAGPMIDRGWGRIVNFSSAASLHPPGPLNSAYGTSKAALNQFTRHLAAELAGTGVTANLIHPGEVKTQMWATIRDAAETAGPLAEPLRAWADNVGRTGGDDPQKAVDLVLELVDDKSAGINGQFLWIAGGMQQPIPGW